MRRSPLSDGRRILASHLNDVVVLRAFRHCAAGRSQFTAGWSSFCSSQQARALINVPPERERNRSVLLQSNVSKCWSPQFATAGARNLARMLARNLVGRHPNPSYQFAYLEGARALASASRTARAKLSPPGTAPPRSHQARLIRFWNVRP